MGAFWETIWEYWVSLARRDVNAGVENAAWYRAMGDLSLRWLLGRGGAVVEGIWDGDDQGDFEGKEVRSRRTRMSAFQSSLDG